MRLDLEIPAKRSEQIALRLRKTDMKILRRWADRRGIGHTTLARIIVEQWIAEAERKG